MDGIAPAFDYYIKLLRTKLPRMRELQGASHPSSSQERLGSDQDLDEPRWKSSVTAATIPLKLDGKPTEIGTLIEFSPMAEA